MRHPDSLYWSLLLVGMFMTGVGKAFHVAWFARDLTQRSRYRWALLALAGSVTALAWLLGRFGLTATIDALRLIREATSPFGWAITVMFWAALLSPAVAALVAIHIFRKPSKLAKRLGQNRYLRTADVRAGVYQPVEVLQGFIKDVPFNAYRDG
ncbi:hypothetical protein HY346_03270 [Candidatus Microgenomates bacterium]|nr:hypothetical protein [Candidatus Microgenomates bacterium]